jgi:protein gp37
MGVTKIEWCDYTMNPWMGCSKVAAGCTHCYAETLMDSRWGKVQWGPNGTRVMASEATWRNPVKWNKAAEGAAERPRVFCASLADIFEDWQGPIVDAKGKRLYTYVDHNASAIDGSHGATMDDLRRKLFALIDATPNLDWLIHTKRPENSRRMWPPTCQKCKDRGWYLARFADNYPTPCDECDRKARSLGLSLQHGQYAKPTGGRPNVWLLTSVAEQCDADKNIPELLMCRSLAPVLGVSAEPLIGPIDFWPYMPSSEHGPAMDGSHLDWVIVGGESGHGARACNLNWVDDIRDQCQAAGVPVFIKQLGAHPFFPFGGNTQEWQSTSKEYSQTHGDVRCINLRDKKGGDWSEWPEDLRVRQYPEVSA